MDLDFKATRLYNQLQGLDEQALPLRVRDNLVSMLSMRTLHSLLTTFLEDLHTIKYPQDLQFEFMSGPVKTLNIGGKAYVCRSFNTYSQFQFLDEDTFKQVDTFKSLFNQTLCTRAFEGACEDWPYRKSQYERETDVPRKGKIKESMILDWLVRLKNTVHLINLASNMLDIESPFYIIEAALYVHAGIYMGGASFFEKRFPGPFFGPTPEIVTSFRYLWPQTYLMWNPDGSCKTFSDLSGLFKQSIRNLDSVSTQLASLYDIRSYKFFTSNYEVGYVRQPGQITEFEEHSRADDDDDLPDLTYNRIGHDHLYYKSIDEVTTPDFGRTPSRTIPCVSINKNKNKSSYEFEDHDDADGSIDERISSEVIKDALENLSCDEKLEDIFAKSDDPASLDLNSSFEVPDSCG